MSVKTLLSDDGRQTERPLGWLARSAATQAAEGTASPRLSLVRGGAAEGSRVELLSAEAAAARRAAWLDLVSRSLEPNVFLEPDFALPAAQHIASARRPAFLFVTGPARFGRPGELIGLAALDLPRRTGRHSVAKAWCHAQAALSLPLLDRTRAGEALELMLGWLAGGRLGAVLFPSLPLGGRLIELIQARVDAGDLRMMMMAQRARAVLRGDGVQPAAAPQISTKHIKEVRRQRRRLSELGRLAYVRSEGKEMRSAAERFLALEASGWKGARGTALLKDPGLAAFTRSMTRLYAASGKCWIDSLELDGSPIAMGVVLKSGEQAYLWKIAYDERYAAFSPGVQFVTDFTNRQAADPRIIRTDSCAIPDHPMIDRLWPDRLEIADILLAPATVPSDVFAATARRETLRRGLRAAAKRAYHTAFGRRPS